MLMQRRVAFAASAAELLQQRPEQRGGNQPRQPPETLPHGRKELPREQIGGLLKVDGHFAARNGGQRLPETAGLRERVVAGEGGFQCGAVQGGYDGVDAAGK